MRQIEIGPITTEWYRPWSEERSAINNFQLGRMRILKAFYGEDALTFYRTVMEGEILPKEKAKEIKEEARAINAHFLQSSKRIYGLPRRTDPQEFYLQQHRGASAVIKYFRDLVPELAGEWEMKDEITDLSDRPSDLLRMLASPAKNIDPTLAYDAQRHATLMYQIGTINARTLNCRLRTVASDVNCLLNKKLFKGPEGHGDNIFLGSHHDDETNQVVGFQDRNNRRPLTAHLKHVPVTVRQTYETGAVHTSSRKKDDSVALVKSWVKALNNGGIIHINDAVQDSVGREYDLMDDTIPPGQFADLVASIIEAEAGAESDLWEIPKVIKVITDDQPDGDHGQSPELSFNARRQIWFENIPTPYELKVSNRETYLNSMLEVGTRNSETGFYVGRSHELFELRRSWIAVRVPFPKERYPVSDYALNTAYVSRSKQIAYGLRNRYKVA